MLALKLVRCHWGYRTEIPWLVKVKSAAVHLSMEDQLHGH